MPSTTTAAFHSFSGFAVDLCREMCVSRSPLLGEEDVELRECQTKSVERTDQVDVARAATQTARRGRFAVDDADVFGHLRCFFSLLLINTAYAALRLHDALRDNGRLDAWLVCMLLKLLALCA